MKCILHLLAMPDMLKIIRRGPFSSGNEDNRVFQSEQNIARR